MNSKFHNIKRLSVLITVLVLLTLKYASAQNSLTVYEAKGKIGFKDSNGKVVLSAQYNSTSCVARCKYRIVTTGDKKGSDKKFINENWSVIDENGALIIKDFPHILSEYDYVNDTIILQVASLDYKNRGLIFLNGKELLPMNCERIGHPDDSYNYFFDYRLIPYKMNGLWGVIDISGKEILKPDYTSLECLTSHPDRRSVITKNGKKGILYSSGYVLPSIYDEVMDYNINTGDKTFIDKADGKLVFGKKPIPLSERYLAVRLDGKSIVVNGFGEVVPEEILNKKIADYKPPTKSEPTELQKEVAKVAAKYSTTPVKQEYRNCFMCDGTGKSKENQRTYKRCPTCGGSKKYTLFNRLVNCGICDKYGKVLDKEWYPACHFCKGTGKVKND